MYVHIPTHTLSTPPQATVDTCDGRASQRWTWGKDGTLSATLSSGATLCLTEFVQMQSIYVKPLAPSRPAGASRASQPVAVAVLNRDEVTHPGIAIDLSKMSFAPAARVTVRLMT